MAKAKHQIQPVDANPDFVAQEKKLLESWYQNGIVEHYLHKNDAAAKRFSFMDGPITANNPMGVHHGWGRTYKDLFQRYKNMQGFRQRFQNGFDCQGLWVEVEVEKELGFKTKKDIEDYGVAEFIQKCKDRVVKYSGIQTEQSKRLGYFMDWANSYFTYSPENNYMIWHFLRLCHQKSWIYQGEDSVTWCPRCQTAISQHEILTADYQELTHQSIYLALPLVDRPDESLLVWTTTPWTIPANIAVAVDPKLTYALVEVGSRRYWLAQDRVKSVFKDQPIRITKTVSGTDLVDLKYAGPFDDLSAVKQVAVAHPDNFHRVVATDPLILPITIEEGTGLVHTAVSAGTEDFKLGQKLALPSIPVIADDASYLPTMGFLAGQNAAAQPEIILDYLKEKKSEFVFRIEPYKHRYPRCWRCGTELVWKIAAEWYIAMDRPDPNDSRRRTLRQKMIDVAKKITWLPEFGLDRELDWLQNMHDWLISKKNRYWGLSLPIWVCEQCHKFEVIGGYEELKSRAIEGWDQFEGKTPHKPFIDAVKLKCDCGGTMSRIPDVGNPWLDAGIVPFSTLKYTTDKKYWQDWFPADFITESFPGQFKNWFYSLIATSTVLEDTNPFKTVLGFATVLDETGREMHKSWGNDIEFNQAADKMGSDVIRWLYTRQNPERNLLFGYTVADETRRRFHMILWNSYRYFANYASLTNWSPDDSTPQLTKLDLWIKTRLDQTIAQVTRSLDQFDMFTATGAIEDLVQDFSTWYIRRSRDRRDAAFPTLYQVLVTLAKLLMPFTPFLADRIYTNLTDEISVHLADWPQPAGQLDESLIDQMKLVRQICELGHAQRKALKLPVRQPLADITISGAASLEINPELLQLIKEELNVEAVKFQKGEALAIELNTKLTPQLLAKGRARQLIRDIQEARKQAGCALDEYIILILPDWPKEYEEEIKRQALAKEIRQGDKLTIVK